MSTAIAPCLTLIVTVIFQEEAAPIAGALAAHHQPRLFEQRGLATRAAIVHGALTWAAERTCSRGR